MSILDVEAEATRPIAASCQDGALNVRLQDGREIRFWPNARASRAVFKFQHG